MAKMVEIDEAELLTSQKARDTLAALMKHPTARRKVLEAYKEVKPDEAIPELDSQQPILAEVAAAKADLEARVKKFEDDQAKRDDDNRKRELSSRWSEGQKLLRTEHRYTDEGIKAVEEMMEKKGIVDHEDGRLLFEAIHPPQQPITPNGSGAWNFLDVPSDGSEDLKKLIETKGENNGLLDKMTREALAEVRGSKR